jgi:quinol monooxygenase YgiN
MAHPIYFLFLARPKRSWYELSEKERQAMDAKIRKSLADVGAKVVLGADCSWSSGQWQFFGVEEYPDIEALQKHVATQHEIGFSQHMEELDFLGSPMPPSASPSAQR